MSFLFRLPQLAFLSIGIWVIAVLQPFQLRVNQDGMTIVSWTSAARHLENEESYHKFVKLFSIQPITEPLTLQNLKIEYGDWQFDYKDKNIYVFKKTFDYFVHAYRYEYRLHLNLSAFTERVFRDEDAYLHPTAKETHVFVNIVNIQTELNNLWEVSNWMQNAEAIWMYERRQIPIGCGMYNISDDTTHGPKVLQYFAKNYSRFWEEIVLVTDLLADHVRSVSAILERWITWKRRSTLGPKRTIQRNTSFPCLRSRKKSSNTHRSRHAQSDICRCRTVFRCLE
jgi:hypothetical protein